MELNDIVDENDNILRTVERGQNEMSDIFRVTGVLILNEKNEILLQLRSKNKKSYPLHWDCSGGGRVSTGKDYPTSAKRELFEETGIKTELSFLGKHLLELDDGRKHFIAFFKGKYHGKINIDQNEVSKMEFFSKDEIIKMIGNGEKIHPGCMFGLKKYFL